MEFSDRFAKEEYVRDIFSRIAGRYDLINRIISLNMDGGWRKAAAAEFGSVRGCRLLDCCCGTGSLTQELSVLVGKTGEVTGVDFSPEMLDRARGKCRDLANVRFFHGDVLNLPFKNSTFHGAASAFALRNLTSIPRALEEMARVVIPGGKVVILELNRPSRPVFKQGFSVYFNRIVPILGSLLSGSGHAYRYLPQSYHFLPQPEDLMSKMCSAGVEDVRYRTMAGGAVALYRGKAV